MMYSGAVFSIPANLYQIYYGAGTTETTSSSTLVQPVGGHNRVPSHSELCRDSSLLVTHPKTFESQISEDPEVKVIDFVPTGLDEGKGYVRDDLHAAQRSEQCQEANQLSEDVSESPDAKEAKEVWLGDTHITWREPSTVYTLSQSKSKSSTTLASQPLGRVGGRLGQVLKPRLQPVTLVPEDEDSRPGLLELTSKPVDEVPEPVILVPKNEDPDPGFMDLASEHVDPVPEPSLQPVVLVSKDEDPDPGLMSLAHGPVFRVPEPSFQPLILVPKCEAPDADPILVSVGRAMGPLSPLPESLDRDWVHHSETQTFETSVVDDPGDVAAAGVGLCAVQLQNIAHDPLWGHQVRRSWRQLIVAGIYRS